MFGIKTKIINNLKLRFTRTGLNTRKISTLEAYAVNLMAEKEIKAELKFADVQAPITKKVNPFAAKIIRKTAGLMPNNLGNWSIKKPYSFTTKLELELIEFIKKKYTCDKQIAGHFGSGSTEGNIYAAWIGKKYLVKQLSFKETSKIVLIKSCLAHYSIDKAADIVGVKLVKTSIKESDFNIDENELIKKIKKLYQDGIRGFMLPLTLGYTVSGTNDNYQEIIRLVNQFKNSHKDCEFFLWIDAAFSGVSLMFSSENFKPFAEKSIQLITGDFHKFLGVPYPASFMLYRKELIKLIEKHIPYIDQMDNTLLGSRSGINVLATWISLLNLDERKIKAELIKSIDEKNKYLENISLECPNIKIINNSKSNQACLINVDKLSAKILEKKIGLKPIDYELLFKNRKKIVKLYKLYFLHKF